MSDMYRDVTEELYGRRILLVAAAVKRIVSVSGAAAGAALLAETRLDAMEPGLAEFLLPTLAIRVEKGPEEDGTCILSDTDAGVRRVLTVDPVSKSVAGKPFPGSRRESSRFRILMTGDHLCAIYSVAEKAWLSVDLAHNLDPDGGAYPVHTEQRPSAGHCLFTVGVYR